MQLPRMKTSVKLIIWDSLSRFLSFLTYRMYMCMKVNQQLCSLMHAHYTPSLSYTIVLMPTQLIWVKIYMYVHDLFIEEATLQFTTNHFKKKTYYCVLTLLCAYATQADSLYLQMYMHSAASLQVVSIV